jgi:holliday junction DNA helicase RuvA
VLELRDKLPEAGPTTTPTASPLSPIEDDVLSALLNLGYQRPAAEKALAAVSQDGGAKSFDQMFRAVLGRLSK